MNIDPQGHSQTVYNKETQELDLSQGELKFLSENYEKINTRLKLETANLKEKENALDKITTVAWEEVTQYLITLRVNFKKNIFRLEEIDISTKYNLALVSKEGSSITYKDKIKDKYSYLRHLTKINLLYFYHHLCEIKLINHMTTSKRFLQQNIHKRKDSAAKFSVHIIPEPRPFKYYNYFDFFDFFEFYQIHKDTLGLHVGRVFHSYLSAADTEIFTTYEKFTDPNGRYKSISDYNLYVLVHNNDYVTTLKQRNHLNIYI